MRSLKEIEKYFKCACISKFPTASLKDSHLYRASYIYIGNIFKDKSFIHFNNVQYFDSYF